MDRWRPAGTLLDPQGQADTTLAVTSSRQSNVTLSYFSLSLLPAHGVSLLSREPLVWACLLEACRQHLDVMGEICFIWQGAKSGRMERGKEEQELKGKR